MDFKSIIEMQERNQLSFIERGVYNGLTSGDVTCVPHDDARLASYHVQHLIAEIGEVLEADKRWKSFRGNNQYDDKIMSSKADEISDCFIILMNIAMYSGISKEMMESRLISKIERVSNRIESDG